MDKNIEMPPRCSPESLERVLARLGPRFGNRLSAAQAVREQHGNTLTWIGVQAPDAVVFATSTEDVVEVVRACADNGVPVIPFGTGTSFEGHVNAPFGGVSVDTSQMNKVVVVHAE